MTREPDPTTNTAGHCDGCGHPLMWGGMSWVPHTVAQHEHLRHRLLDVVRHQLHAKLGARLGHQVVLRFTADVAWTECRGCSWVGPWVPHSGVARRVGTAHLARVALLWLDEAGG